MLGTAAIVLGVAALAALAWGWFEAGWVRLRTRDVEIRGLPRELDGLRIAHLSDFHLGVPSRGIRAVERAVAWTADRRPDLVCVTGDLMTHPRGERRLRELLRELSPCYVVLGNHDFGDARDPLAKPSHVTALDPARLLRDDSALVDLRGRRVQLVGVDPTTYARRAARPEQRADEDADLRILLCHFPRVFDRVRDGTFQLVLAGHLHDGQIALPYGFGKLRFAHLHARYPAGIYRREGSVMHVSPGLGTTFVPFRFSARPEATELTLRSA